MRAAADGVVLQASSIGASEWRAAVCDQGRGARRARCL